MEGRRLTPAETRVLKAYVDYEKHEPAAQALGISTQTLKNHLGSIYKKLNVKKAHSAVYALAIQQGVDPFAPNTVESDSTDNQKSV